MKRANPRSYEAVILARLTGLGAAAKGLLALEFGASDRARMNALAAKARADELSDRESDEIEAYSRIGSLLGILKSKARQALKRRAVKGDAAAK